MTNAMEQLAREGTAQAVDIANRQASIARANVEDALLEGIRRGQAAVINNRNERDRWMYENTYKFSEEEMAQWQENAMFLEGARKTRQ